MLHTDPIRKLILFIGVVIVLQVLYNIVIQLDASNTRDAIMALLIALVLQPFVIRQIEL